MDSNTNKTIVFITGAFISHRCWDNWVVFFGSSGYQCIVAPWPNKEDEPEILRNRQPDPAIASMRLSILTDHYAALVAALPEKPILIGHSLGGLVVQLLLQRGLATAGIAIHSVAPQGVLSFNFSFFKAGWAALGVFSSVKKSYLISFKNWQYAFANEMPLEEQKASYYQLAIPESKLVVRDTITKAARINFENPHAPLLFISGTADHSIPASLNYSNYKKYRKSNSVTHYQEFKGSNHLVLYQTSWKQEADYILCWLEKH